MTAPPHDTYEARPDRAIRRATLWRTCWFAACFVLAAARPYAAETPAAVDPAADCRARIVGEDVVITRMPSSGQGVAMRACGRIAAAPADVWPIVSRCQHFKDFMPSTKNSELLRREPGVSVCATHIDAPFPLSDLHSVTHNDERQLASGGYERRWRLLRGSYRRSEGGWTLLPWPGEEEATLLIYDVDIEMGAVPDFILHRVQAATVPTIFAAVRQRVVFCADPDNAEACGGP